MNNTTPLHRSTGPRFNDDMGLSQQQSSGGDKLSQAKSESALADALNDIDKETAKKNKLHGMIKSMFQP